MTTIDNHYDNNISILLSDEILINLDSNNSDILKNDTLALPSESMDFLKVHCDKRSKKEHNNNNNIIGIIDPKKNISPTLKYSPTTTMTTTASATTSGSHIEHHHRNTLKSSFCDLKIGAYTKEERKQRIERFRQKKMNRIWRKQIKYDCRKRLADTRPRVKGRFVSRSSDFVDDGQTNSEASSFGAEDSLHFDLPNINYRFHYNGSINNNNNESQFHHFNNMSE